MPGNSEQEDEALACLWHIRWVLKVKFKWLWSNAMNSARRIKFVGQYVTPCAPFRLVCPQNFLCFLGYSSPFFQLLYLERWVTPAVTPVIMAIYLANRQLVFLDPGPLFGLRSLCWPFTFMAILAGSSVQLFGRLQLINWPVMSFPPTDTEWETRTQHVAVEQ